MRSKFLSRVLLIIVCFAVSVALAGLLDHLANDLHLQWAESLVRPFGLLGFVFGNPHQGSDTISFWSLTVMLAVFLAFGWTIQRRIRGGKGVPEVRGTRFLTWRRSVGAAAAVTALTVGYLFGGGPHGVVGGICGLLLSPGLLAAGFVMSLTERAVPDGLRAAGGAVFVVIAFAVDWAVAVAALAGLALLRKGGSQE